MIDYEKYHLIEASIVFLITAPFFLAFFTRAPRKTLIASLILSICLNPSILLMENTRGDLSVSVSLYLSDIFLGLCWLHIFLAKALHKASTVSSSVKMGRLLSLFLLWFGFGIFSTIFAIDKGAALFEVLAMARVLLTFFAVYYLVQSKSDLSFVAILILTSCLFQALLILSQYGFDAQILRLPGQTRELDIIGGGAVFRPGGTLGHSSNFAKLAALSIPISFSLFQINSSKFMKGFWGAVSIVIMLSLMATISRIGLFTGLLGIAWILALSLKTAKGRRIFLSSAFVCLIALSAAWVVGGDRLTQRISNDESSSEARIPMWLTACQVIVHNPMGVGLNNYLNVAVKYDDFGIVRAFPFPVHNIYLLYLAETGIAGGVIFLMLLYCGVKNCFETSRLTMRELDIAILISIGIGIACSWLQGLVGWGHRQNVLHLSYFAVLTATVIAYRNISVTETMLLRQNEVVNQVKDE